MTEGPLIALQGIGRSYGEGEAEVRALDGVDLTIRRGEFVAIMGPSGSGKSTAMNIIGCLDRPTSGRYLFEGTDVSGLDRDGRALLRRHFLGFVFQGFNLLARTTALENVELPLIYGACRGPSGSRRRSGRWRGWGLPGASITIPRSSRAASSSGWPSPARWRANPR